MTNPLAAGAPALPPDLWAPLALLLLAGAGFLFASRRAARPADPARPRLLPWRLIALACGFGAFIAGLYLASRVGAVLFGAALPGG